MRSSGSTWTLRTGHGTVEVELPLPLVVLGPRSKRPGDEGPGYGSARDDPDDEMVIALDDSQAQSSP
ncbi:MAG: hypothetical protein ACRELB_02975 [Polyangiaceae bacterium]